MAWLGPADNQSWALGQFKPVNVAGLAQLIRAWLGRLFGLSQIHTHD